MICKERQLKFFWKTFTFWPNEPDDFDGEKTNIESIITMSFPIFFLMAVNWFISSQYGNYVAKCFFIHAEPVLTGAVLKNTEKK